MSKIIRVSDETHELVDSLGLRGETFDEIIKRVFTMVKMGNEEKKFRR